MDHKMFLKTFAIHCQALHSQSFKGLQKWPYVIPPWVVFSNLYKSKVTLEITYSEKEWTGEVIS